MKSFFSRAIGWAWLHPPLVACLPVLNLYRDNMQLAEPRLLLRPLAAFVAAALILCLALRLLLRQARKTGLVVTLLLVFLFYFQPVRLLLPSRLRVAYPWFMAAWAALFCCALLLAMLAHREWRRATRLLNLFALASFLFLAASICRFECAQRRLDFPRFPGDLQPLADLAGPPAGGEPLPDIYYIVVDGYGRQDVLHDIYRLDNRPFLDFLRAHGFRVADAACSGYSQTLFSLASSLNMRYLDDVSRAVGAGSMNRRPLLRLIRDSDLAFLLKARGYRIVACESLYSATRLGGGQVHGTPWDLTDFEIMLLNGSLLEPHFRNLFHRVHARVVRDTFATLGRLDPALTPKFVFAHVLCPHPPFVFSRGGRAQAPATPFLYADGNHLVRSIPAFFAYLQGYREQVQFVNRQLADMIAAILKNSRRDPVIIIQGDHGPGAMLQHDSAERSDLRERLGILNAVRLPPSRPAPADAAGAPANNFRIVLNALFAARLPLLEARSHFLRWHRPHDPVAVARERLQPPGTAGGGG